MSDPYTDQAKALATLFAENGVLRAEVEQLQAELEAEITRLQADIDKFMDERQGWLEEIEQLRAGIDQIVGMCLGNVGIGKIYAAACALLEVSKRHPASQNALK
jgi:hypothetical protein